MMMKRESPVERAALSSAFTLTRKQCTNYIITLLQACHPAERGPFAHFSLKQFAYQRLLGHSFVSFRLTQVLQAFDKSELST